MKKYYARVQCAFTALFSKLQRDFLKKGPKKLASLTCNIANSRQSKMHFLLELQELSVNIYMNRAVLYSFTHSVFSSSPQCSHTGGFILFHGSPDLLPANMFINNHWHLICLKRLTCTSYSIFEKYVLLTAIYLATQLYNWCCHLFEIVLLCQDCFYEIE